MFLFFGLLDGRICTSLAFGAISTIGNVEDALGS